MEIIKLNNNITIFLTKIKYANIKFYNNKKIPIIKVIV